MQSLLHVSIGAATYRISIGSNLKPAIRHEIQLAVAGGRRIAVLVDANACARHKRLLDLFFAGMPCLKVQAGETGKSLRTYGRVLEFMARCRLDRGSLLWIIGGGVVGDVGGFAAATYLRGIDCIQVPTTLLAMVDSAVGGKTGINLAAGKNLVGAFHQPRAVFVMTDFLRTLPAREFAAGTAEIIKCGLLGDVRLFARLARAPLTRRSADLPGVIRRCCALKARLVSRDERETAPDGGRALLNLGHTFGHAVEQASGFKEYRHGEAVAIGLAGAALLSQKLGLLASRDVARVRRTLTAQHLPVRLRTPLALSVLRRAMQHDKKNRGGRPRFIVLERIGHAVVRADVRPALVDEVWRELGARG